MEITLQFGGSNWFIQHATIQWKIKNYSLTFQQFLRRNETLCFDVNDYAELISGLRIWNSCSVPQLSTLEQVNSQYKIIFKTQGVISGRDFAVIGSNTLLVIYITYWIWLSFLSNKLSLVAWRCPEHGQNNFGAVVSWMLLYISMPVGGIARCPF
jgi:hypothetical protein